ncbi:MAG: beta-propeller fold lactonase family protein [Gammaproteobacteria bacterium]|jgi:xylono-1,5-lactonase|nr:beta-propeller fold lactonase family protein [Gammaproteobacteria bacterium]MBT7372052.1 beta-propeller fold lactonase family protein [Gammaproteobacteria bacterium]
MEKLAEGYSLVEGPVWVPGRGLMFSDVLNGGVFCIDDSGSLTTIFAHRRGIGGMSLHENGGMIVSGRNISWKSNPEGETRTLLDENEEAGVVGFNDITTDSLGRIYAGGLGSSPVFDDGREPRPGDLYLIDLDGSARVVARDIMLTNGMGFSPDGKTLYHSDTRRQHINAYAVDSDGTLGEKQIFVETAGTSPDGMAISEDGRLWVALANGHGVGVYNPDGSIDHLVEIPQQKCTSVCFGGDDLRDLYVVSGSDDSGGDRPGAVYRTRADVAGLEVPLARVALPPSS